MTAADRSAVPHPDLDTLADLDAGVLDGAAVEEVAAHVAACAHCGRVLTALGGVRADLRALPVPPLPAAVAERLDDTLADLRRTDLAGTDGDQAGAAPGDRGSSGRRSAPSARPAPVVDLAAARQRRWRRLKVVSGAAAAAVAVVVAGASLNALIRTSGSAEGGGGGSAEVATAERAADSGKHAAPSSASSGLADSAGAGSANSARVPAYTRATLLAALPTIERESAVGIVTARGAAGPAGVMADPARRTACAGTIPGSRGDLRAVRRISYEGTPAYVFVFGDAGRRTGYVVSEQCGSSAALPAAVLDTVR